MKKPTWKNIRTLPPPTSELDEFYSGRKKKFKHDELIDYYVSYLRKTYPFDEFYKKTIYDFGVGRNGEIDLLRVSLDDCVFRTRHIYEFKTKDTEGQKTKALRQLNRIKRDVPYNQPGWLSIRYYYARQDNNYLLVDEYKNGELSELEKIALDDCKCFFCS